MVPNTYKLFSHALWWQKFKCTPTHTHTLARSVIKATISGYIPPFLTTFRLIRVETIAQIREQKLCLFWSFSSSAIFFYLGYPTVQLRNLRNLSQFLCPSSFTIIWQEATQPLHRSLFNWLKQVLWEKARDPNHQLTCKKKVSEVSPAPLPPPCTYYHKYPSKIKQMDTTSSKKQWKAQLCNSWTVLCCILHTCASYKWLSGNNVTIFLLCRLIISSKYPCRQRNELSTSNTHGMKVYWR